MALIKCPECNKDVSQMATNCPNCGCPIKKESGKATFKIDGNWNDGFRRTAEIHDIQTKKVIATLKMGGTTSFEVNRNMTVQIKLSGYFGKPTVELSSNKHTRIKVNISPMGKIYTQEVDFID
jgi:hypothetical protein